MNSTAELALSYRQQIESNQVKSIALDAEIKRVVLAKLNLTRSQGLVLQACEDALDPKTFEEVSSSLGGNDAVQRFIRFARKYRDEITEFGPSFKSAFVAALKASGALALPKGRTEISRDPPGFLAMSARLIMTWKVGFAKYLAAKPLSSWQKSELEQFLFGLRPIMKVHKQISDWLARQEKAA